MPAVPRKPLGPKPKFPKQNLGARDAQISVRRANLHEPLLARERTGLKPVDIIRRDLLRFWTAADDSASRLALSREDLEKIGKAIAGVAFDDPKHARMLPAFVAAELGDDDPIVDRLKGAGSGAWPLAVLYGVIDAADRAWNNGMARDEKGDA
jgi:hypothetical protein